MARASSSGSTSRMVGSARPLRPAPPGPPTVPGPGVFIPHEHMRNGKPENWRFAWDSADVRVTDRLPAPTRRRSGYRCGMTETQQRPDELRALNRLTFRELADAVG